ncbi:MAG: SDR family oxidoreductase [Alphaproteobacteria bacterium]|nr:SDR family oxidoreductase [Alphaproteobacteria bacterium]
MAGRLEGKKALVTAAAQGIGRSIVEKFVAEGASVLATDINMDVLSGLDGVANVTTARLDVTDAEAVKAVAAQAGALDVLVNCAGFVHHGTILECDEADYDFSFDINVRGAYRMIRATLPGMLESGGGSIVNISSVASSIAGVPNRFVYGTTKAAVLGLTKSVAKDFVEKGVRCNAICPGTVDTPSLQDRINAFDDPVAARKAFIARQPMGRLGTAEEIAALALYLASDESGFVTGEWVVIDGGMTV